MRKNIPNCFSHIETPLFDVRILDDIRIEWRVINSALCEPLSTYAVEYAIALSQLRNSQHGYSYGTKLVELISAVRSFRDTNENCRINVLRDAWETQYRIEHEAFLEHWIRIEYVDPPNIIYSWFHVWCSQRRLPHDLSTQINQLKRDWYSENSRWLAAAEISFRRFILM